MASSADLPSAPLADHFFICGIESSQVFEEKSQSNGLPTPPLRATIDEEKALGTDQTGSTTSPASTINGDVPPQRRSRFGHQSQKSIGSMAATDSKNATSNRSSGTVRLVSDNGDRGEKIALLNTADFEEALRRFASERENFLEEIKFSAGVITAYNRPKPRLKAHKTTDEYPDSPKAGMGSIRRRMPTMNSTKRQTSVSRQPSIQTSKRLSGYNSVIPAPQPFVPAPDMHPLRRKYEPVLLDRYPPKDNVEELKRRNPFPDYVPMFAFPNDVSVVSADERPKSTWHGFAMTNADGSRLYGICLIMWMPLNQGAADELERQCEDWRQNNMTSEERELAISLSERLAAERALLSRLLAELPSLPSGSEDRERLGNEISTVEEKIGLMTDMLRPVRHGAACKIDGLTDGDTGLWIPRAYGVLGRDGNLTSFWKEWLRAVAIPMTNGSVLRIPPTSPKVGMWQPLERYVVNLCAEALSPVTSLTQVEVAVRELRMYARREAINELPGSRNIDLYPLFRCLSIPNIIILMEYVLSESRIILVSSYTAMLHLATASIVHLLYPLEWVGIFIPVLPSRLIQALEAPCPYIVGIERRYESVELPEDDFVLVDLDQDSIKSTAPPTPLPRQQRRKLFSLLQLAAPHHSRYGIPTGPPAYAVESFPNNSFPTENHSVFNAKASPSSLSRLVSLTSTSFGAPGTIGPATGPIFNTFLHPTGDLSHLNHGFDRPSTASTARTHVAAPPKLSPVSNTFQRPPSRAISRSDSGYALQANLREKRSGHFDRASQSWRDSTFGLERSASRRPRLPFGQHSSAGSISINGGVDHNVMSQYPPSIYAPSTLAASTLMPSIYTQPVFGTETTCWAEGHYLQLRPYDEKATCSICDEKDDEGMYRCNCCGIVSHGRCVPHVCLPCQSAFHPDQIRAAFVRCFASLFLSYRRFMHAASGDRKKSGMLYHFDMDGFLRSLPSEHAEYMVRLRETQAFNEFIHERETTKADDPSIKLFDEIILSKRNRGRTAVFSRASTNFLSDISDHLWQSAAADAPNSGFPGDYRAVISRIPAKLDPTLMKEPRVFQSVPRVPQSKARRKPIPSMLGPSSPPKHKPINANPPSSTYALG